MYNSYGRVGYAPVSGFLDWQYRFLCDRKHMADSKQAQRLYCDWEHFPLLAAN